MLRVSGRLLVAFACCLAASNASAQDQTIPQKLSSTADDIGAEILVEFEGVPTLDSIISVSEVVVRGRVASPHTYLSDDQKSVYSEYEVVEPQILDDPNGILAGSSPSVRFKQLGGTISMYGYKYTLIQRNLPPLAADAEYLLLLKRIGDNFEAAGVYFGAFQFGSNKLTSIGLDGFAPELRTMTADDAVAHILNRIQAVRR